MEIIEKLYKEYPFAFEYRASQLTDSNEKTILCLKGIETIENEFNFLLISTEEKCDFIADICTNINFILDTEYYKEERFILNSTEYDIADLTQSYYNDWNNFYKKYNDLLTFENNKKEVETNLNNLKTKAQKINYLNRYIADYKTNNVLKKKYNFKGEITHYSKDNSVSFVYEDKTINFLYTELKFWENYIEEPEQQKQINFENIEWNKQIIDLSELIYVLHKSKSIYKNGKNITQKDLTILFNQIFNTDITNVSDNLNKGFETYKRSDDNKTYIKSLYDIIEQRIKEKNNKK